MSADWPEFKLSYGKGRFPIRQKRPDGEWGCRGCGALIPKGRQTWCSNVCLRLHHPFHVIHAVKQRDKGICQLCFADIKSLYSEWYKLRPKNPQGVIYNSEAGRIAFAEYYQFLRRWERDCPDAEYDHVVPFSEGGLTILDNMRTVCGPCHRKRTREWHVKRKLLTA